MAAPNPEKELQRLQAVLAERDPPRVVLLQGPARWFQDRALDEIRRRVGDGSEWTELDGSESSGSAREAGQFLVDLRTPSLFGARKLLLLRNAEAWLRQHGAALSGTISRIAAGNMLVLALLKLDGRSALARRIKKEGASFEFRHLYGTPFEGRPATSAEVVQWVQQRARAHDLELDPQAALLMTEVAGADPGPLDGELARLAPILGRGRVDPEALRGQLMVGFGSSQFELIDAILLGDAKLALRSLSALFRQGMRDKSGKPIEQAAVFPIVTSWLLQSITKLLAARSEIDCGAAKAAVVAQHGGFFKERFARQLDRHSVASLVAVLAALRRAERRLRTSSETPQVVLERLVCETLLEVRDSLLGNESRAW